MAKLYELTSNYKNLLELAEEEEISKEILMTAMEQVEGDISEKIENIIKLIRNLEGNVKIYKDEEKFFSSKRKATERNIDSLKKYVEETLNDSHLKELNTKLFNCKFVKSKPIVEITDEELIPHNYIQVEKKIDKNNIYNAIKLGEEVPGAMLKENIKLRIK